ncbi:TauD/TfdA family dioxygenase [Planctomycetes bacterium K23_9]|uniref:Taurine catabolism dioxygenase TauD, TfdA family n=1 Tax=Stieleria marina TaxID=1930275 RepID=A0A517NRV0_9BACT|nr:Taurine catabolism dioxygenase TauD, TfdA family [Planctomycetes bacterium K23_9]
MPIQPTPVEGQQTYSQSVFPFAYTSDEPCTLGQATQWISENRERLLEEANTHGAVLFRGMGVESVEGFDAMVASLSLENFPYKKSLSNAVRVNRTERVFSANEAPPEVQIFFHHEMAQTPLFPKWILFSCEIAPQEGGATPLCRSDVLFERLLKERPEFAQACENRGLQYSNVMPGIDDAASGMGRSWASTLGVDNKEAAEARLAELGYSWEWLASGDLRATTPPLPAVMELADGRKTFFNQLIAAFCGWKDERNDPSSAIRHGDGTVLDADAVRHAATIADEITFDMNWQVGDVVLIDNTVVMHARRSFVGKRKVVASLAQMQTQSFQVA